MSHLRQELKNPIIIETYLAKKIFEKSALLDFKCLSMTIRKSLKVGNQKRTNPGILYDKDQCYFLCDFHIPIFGRRTLLKQNSMFTFLISGGKSWFIVPTATVE